MAQFVVYQAADRAWRWRLVEDNHRIIADSAEGYISKSNVVRAIKNVVSEIVTAMEGDQVVIKELKK